MNREQALLYITATRKNEENNVMDIQYIALYLNLFFIGLAFLTAPQLYKEIFIPLLGVLTVGDILLTIVFSIRSTPIKKWAIYGINSVIFIIVLDFLAFSVLVSNFSAEYLIVFIGIQAVASILVGYFTVRTEFKKHSQNCVKPQNPSSFIIGGSGLSAYFLSKVITGMVEKSALPILLAVALLCLCITWVMICAVCFYKTFLAKKHNITNADIEQLIEEDEAIDFESEN